MNSRPNKTVTFVAYDWPNNVCGPAAWLCRLLPALRERNITPRCLTLCWDAPGPLVDDLKHLDVDCEYTLCEGDTESRITWILNQLAAQPPDVFVPNLVVPAMHAGQQVRGAGIPTVGVLHSDDKFYRGICDVFAAGRQQDSLTDLVCVSTELEQQLSARKLARTRTHRIAYGVPIPKEPTRGGEDKLQIAYVGRLSEVQKQISEVTRAFCQAARTIDGVEASLFGDGPDRANVETILENEGRDLPVELVGRVSPEEIQRRLLGFDVIVLLSDYEGLPIALLEAMACGVVPVCLQMRSGIPELVTHEATGLVVNDRHDEFVNAIRRLKDDSALLPRLSAAARERVMTDNSVQACADQWAALLHKLAEQSTQTSPIKTPEQFDLPPVHPALASEDPRRYTPSFVERINSKGRRIAGKLAHLVSGRAAD